MKVSKPRITICILCLMGATAAGLRAAPAAGKPLSILFIGNSYTSVNQLPSIVQAMAASAGYAKPEVGANLPGGRTLLQHSQNPKTLELVDQGSGGGAPWDVVVLQEQSQTPAFAEVNPGIRQGFLDGAKSLCQRIRKRSPNARVVLYQTWARHAEVWETKPAEVQALGASPGEMQNRIRKSYQALAEAMNHGAGRDVFIAPVGDTWEINYRSPHPVRLHGNDGSHPNPSGSYLAGLVLFATIYDASPNKVTWLVPGVPEADAAVLKKLAAEPRAKGNKQVGPLENGAR